MQHDTTTRIKTTIAQRRARTRRLSILFMAVGVLALAGVSTGRAPNRTAPDREGNRADVLSDEMQSLLEEIIETAESGGEGHDDEAEIPLASLAFFIEFNETDADVGVQCSLGGEPYKLLRAYGPDGKKILDLRPRRGLKRQGLSDFFFESAEPSLDEFSLADFLERFAEGEYEFETTTIDGLAQGGETELTHAIPAGPVITGPLEGDVVDPDRVVITWEPVTMTTAHNPPQRPVEIVGYQVIVTQVEPHRVYAVDVPADRTSLSVAPEFLEAGQEYELEILAVEASDNQTISLLFFHTAE